MSDLVNAGNDKPTARKAPADLFFQQAVFWKVAWRLIPFMFVLYMVNILDRTNVAIASRRMLKDLDMRLEVYDLAAPIFYVGYVLFEVPSNLILRRTGARLWIGRIMISWGIVSASMIFVRDPSSFYLVRFLLGVAEAGFFPGMILYLTYWFPARERARTVAFFMTASAVTGIVFNPISGAILDNMDNVAGLRSWQWLFLLEGIPAVVLGFAVFAYLRDRPRDAPWLTPPERAWLTERVGREEEHRERRHALTLLRAMTEPRVWLLCLLYLTLAITTSSFGFYLPKLIAWHDPELSDFTIGWLMVPPHVAAVVSMVLVGLHSDRTLERRWHVAVPGFVAAAGWVLCAYAPSLWLFLVGVSLAAAGMWSMLAPFWSLPTSFLSGVAAAGGIALINSLGNVGGFIGPYAFGWLRDPSSGSYLRGLLMLALILLLGGILALCARHDPNLEKPPAAE
jgi:ACS family tartrate transporter-like MFS transporter